MSSVAAENGPYRERDPERCAGALVARFLDGRVERTVQAYSTDIDDFGRFAGRDARSGLARLLAGGHESAHRLVLDFTIDLRRRRLAPATIERRLSTLRALARLAYETGLIEWALEMPDEAEVSAAIEDRVTSGVPYLFPRHPTEADRLDVQHYALREILGANHLAPVDRPPRALDVGSGTGQWSFELCERFPDALVVGLDLVASKPRQPPGYRWVRANLLKGLPFRADSFDFVFQRLLVVGVPLAAWPAAVAELVRVARPGGWVELVEPMLRARRAGPAMARFTELALGLAAARGLDSHRTVFDSLDGLLRDAGLTAVVRREVPVPVGRWGGRVGSFMATDTRAAQARMSAVLQDRSLATAEECRALVQETTVECERLRMEAVFAFVFGRKPAIR
jgi:SAM-dependent methyltransferase